MVNKKLVAAGIITSVAVVAGVSYILLKRRPSGELTVGFGGFALKKVNGSQTTTRQSTGETAKDFQFYPLINVTPDVNGDFTVEWSYSNKFNGTTYNSGLITNVFTGLVGGVAKQLQLMDNRPADGRDPTRNGAIAIGDKDFVGLGKQDGLWHSFRSDVSVKVKSPSGAEGNVTGTLGPENFKSTGALSAAWAGWAVTKQLQKTPAKIDALLY